LTEKRNHSSNNTISMSDSEDSQLEAEYAKVVEAAATQPPTKKAARTIWPKIDRHQRVGGKQVVVHPFLAADNEMDKIAVRHLIVDEPYLAKHGDVSKAWTECVNNINADDNSSPGDRVFFPPLTTKMLKTCFDAYMKFAAASKQDVPFHSGCDDEEEACEILAGIEEMHEKYMSFIDDKENDKSNALSKKKNDARAADVIRRASLGNKPTDEELEECGNDKNSKRKKAHVSSVSSISMSDGGSLQESLEKRNHIALMKEENKKRKLLLYEKKMEADAKKMEADAKVADAMHALIMKLADKI
jgi:hypothetical protein